MKKIILIGICLFGISIKYLKAQCCENASSHPSPNMSAGKEINFCDLAINTQKTSVREEGENLVFTTVIENKTGNNSSKDARVIVQLPGETTVIRFRQIMVFGNNKSIKLKQCGGILVGEIESLDPISTKNAIEKTQVTFEVVTSKPKLEAARTPNFGVYVYNQIPDAVLCNNNWLWRQVAPTLCTNCTIGCNLPDLSFGDVSVDWTNKKITAVIFNNGISPAHDISVYFDGDESPTSQSHRPQISKVIPSINAGSNATLIADFSSLSHLDNANLSRIFQVTIRIDPKLMIKECIKDDNVQSINVR